MSSPHEVFANIDRGDGVYTSEHNDRIHCHGQGTYVCKNGDIYKGVWKHGKKNGNGIIYLADGTAIDVIYYDDKPIGTGICWNSDKTEAHWLLDGVISCKVGEQELRRYIKPRVLDNTV